jgi:predicted nucleic acid-binding protein
MILVDCSVVLAALFAAGRTRDVILQTPHPLVAPAALREEVARNLDRVADRTGLAKQQLQPVVDAVLDRIVAVGPQAYEARREEASRLCGKAQAWRDDEYVALALALDAPIWTLDRDFARIPGIQMLDTDGVEGD